MARYEFHNIEILDGYFSGVVYILEKDRYIVEIGYDVELDTVKLLNCSDIMHNSNMEQYSLEELEDIKNRNYYDLKNEIQQYIKTYGDVVFAEY